MLAATLLLALVNATDAAADAAFAFLLRGPHADAGLFFLSPNAIEHFYGEYQHGEHRVGIFYTEKIIVSGEAWLKVPCADLPTLQVPWGESDVWFADSGEGWSVFFDFQSDYTDPCAFVDLFLRRLRYFNSLTVPEGVVPLPAILEFR